MGFVSVALATTSGITIGTGIINLFLGLRQKRIDKVSVSLAIFAFFYAGLTLGGVFRYNAQTYEQYLIINRWLWPIASLTFISLLFFVAFYTDTWPRWFLAAMSVVFLYIAYRVPQEIGGIAFVTLSWGVFALKGHWTDTVKK